MNWTAFKIGDPRVQFLEFSNGAEKHTDIRIDTLFIGKDDAGVDFLPTDREAMISNLNNAHRKGHVERFDSTFGRNCTLCLTAVNIRPTPTQAMAAKKIPVLHGETSTASIMGWGFNPYLSKIHKAHITALCLL